MPSFGEQSLKQYDTIDKRLQEIVDEAVKIFDFAIICGFRNQKQQNEAFKKKRSKLRWPNSKHNRKPSKAVDIAPWNPVSGKVDWSNHKRFTLLAGIIIGIAHTKNIKLKWGGDWDGDTYMRDESIPDMAHFEIDE